MPPARRSRAKNAAWPQAVAVLIGVLFVIVGVIGFAATGLGGFADRNTPDRLFGIAVNPLQNLVHLAFGIAGIVLSARLPKARVFGWVLAIGFGALFGYGLLATRYPTVDLLNLNWPGNWLHLAFAVIGLAIAVGPVPASARTRAEAQRQGA